MFKYSKDGITVFTILDTRRPLHSGKYPVRVQVAYNRKQKYYSTGKDLSANEWNVLPSTKAKTLIDIRRDIESSFQNVRNVVGELADAGGFSFDALNGRLKAGTADTLNTAFRARIAELYENNQIATGDLYELTLATVERFAGKSVRFDSITPRWLEKYEQFLRSENNSLTTISIRLRTIRATINIARRAGIVKEAQYPFAVGRFKIQEDKKHIEGLTVEQLKQVAQYDDGTADTAKYRDFWLFLFFCNGINVADLVELKYRNIVNGEIRFVRRKTAKTASTQTEICVHIVPEMQNIIEKYGNPPKADNYIFPVLKGDETAPKALIKRKAFTRAINERMNDIADKLGIHRISTNIARHTFATILKDNGVSVPDLAAMLGHTDIKTTQIYLDRLKPEARKKNAEILTKIFE